MTLPVSNVQEVVTLVDVAIAIPPHQFPFNSQFCKLSVKTFAAILAGA